MAEKTEGTFLMTELQDIFSRTALLLGDAPMKQMAHITAIFGFMLTALVVQDATKLSP